MEEIAKDLIVGQSLSYSEISKIFLPDITELGEEIIGECFLVCKLKECPEFTWSFMMDGYTTQGMYRLIYKYTG